MLTEKDIIDAMTRSGTGVVKTQQIGANAGYGPVEALRIQLNQILKAKEASN